MHLHVILQLQAMAEERNVKISQLDGTLSGTLVINEILAFLLMVPFIVTILLKTNVSSYTNQRKPSLTLNRKSFNSQAKTIIFLAQTLYSVCKSNPRVSNNATKCADCDAKH